MNFGLSDERLLTAIRLSNEATAKDSAGNLTEAFELYKLALANWRVVCKFQHNHMLRERLYKRMEGYMSRAEELKQYLQLQGSHPHLQQPLLVCEASPATPPSPLKTIRPTKTSTASFSRTPSSLSPNYAAAEASGECRGSTLKPEATVEGERVKMKLARERRIDPFSPPSINEGRSDVNDCAQENSTECLGCCRRRNHDRKAKLQMVRRGGAGLESAKEALQEAVILPSRFPSLFTGERRPWRGILLYGVRPTVANHQQLKEGIPYFPPGTGKTFLAKALAAEADATILSVSAADLVSKWQGESEKLVRSLFEMARERRPSIIFIDEIDSMCGARSESDTESSRRMKTEFLIQMQGINFDLSEVLVLGATNTPWALDAAIRRRFEKRIFIPLPSLEAREQLLRFGLDGTPHHLTNANFRYLAQQLKGFSGSDISVLVRDALFEPIRKCRIAKAFKQVTVEGSVFFAPCQQDDADPTARRMSIMSVPSNRLLPPEVTMGDFHTALRHARPSVSAEDLRMHVLWTEQFGLDGN